MGQQDRNQGQFEFQQMTNDQSSHTRNSTKARKEGWGLESSEKKSKKGRQSKEDKEKKESKKAQKLSKQKSDQGKSKQSQNQPDEEDFQEGNVHMQDPNMHAIKQGADPTLTR